VPLSEIPNFIRKAGDCVKRLGKMRINCFGHLGDGNLHYNIFPYPGVSSKDYAKVNEVLESELYSLIHEMDGSISAEHGIGRHKVKHLKDFCDPVKMTVMRSVKQALDPVGILNPGVLMSD
jgi:FAD/FMN-containing dehydrogenase